MTPFERKLRGQIAELAAAGHSRASASAEIGICTATLRRWLAKLDPERAIQWPSVGHSRAARANQQRPRKSRSDGRPLTASDRQLLARIGELARSGLSKLEAAEQLGIHRATLDRWLAWVDPDRTLPWPPRGGSRRARRHAQRIRLRVVAVGGRPTRLR